MAVAENGVIGRGNRLPWHLPADLRHFKSITLGHPVIMGRRTFESIGRPLPQRRNLVLSRDPHCSAAGAEVAGSLAAALEQVNAATEVFVLGGAAVFAAAMPHAEQIYLTRVHALIDGDTTFPALDEQWQLISSHHHDADADNALPHSFQLWQRTATVASD